MTKSDLVPDSGTDDTHEPTIDLEAESDSYERPATTLDSSNLRPTLSRRSCLRGAAVAGLSGLGVTAANAARGAEEFSDRFADYGTVIDVVEAGADNTGSQPITDVVRQYCEDDTLLVFPPGRYLMDEQIRFTGFENFGLLGNDATLVPANYHDFEGPRYRLFRLGVSYSPGRDLLFEGFTVDQTAPETGIRVIEANVSDGLEVRDVTIDGQHDSGTWGPGRFNVTDPDGSGIVERFRAPDGGAWVDETPNAGNLWRGPTGILANQNRGTLTFRHCTLGPFPDNGLYASDGTGTIVVEGGLYSSSNASNIRIGGSASTVRWATVEIDDDRPQDTSQRGIRLEKGDDLRVDGAAVRITNPMPNSHAISVMDTCDEARIENTTVEISGNDVNHGIVISPEAGRTVVVDTEITSEASGGYPLWICPSDRTEGVRCEHVTISGRAGTDGGFRDGVRCERDNCTFNVLDVSQPSDGLRNAIVNTGDDCKIYRGEYRASKFPIVDLGSGTLVREIYAESDGGYEAVCLYDQSENVALKQNTLVDGIKDLGCAGLVTWGNTF